MPDGEFIKEGKLLFTCASIFILLTVHGSRCTLSKS